MGGAGEHADVGTGAEHARLGRAQHHDLDLGVLEAQPLHGVGELDVDAEIIGIQLELVALEQAAILVDIHGKRRHLAVDRQLPMTIAGGIGLEIDERLASREHAVFPGHESPLRWWAYR